MGVQFMKEGMERLAPRPELLLVGFFTKFILFQAVVEADYLWLVVIGVIASTISLYYYLVVIKQMYLYEPEGDTSRWRISPTGYLTTGSLLGAVVVLGIWGTPLFRASHEAALALFAGV